jgi:acetylglutamate/LysW-gamma-L-alpha-aminoadipate kinase
MRIIKIGGAKGTDLSYLMEDLKDQSDYILVHGGSDEMNRISEELGKSPRIIRSPSGHVSRYTDRETLDILKMTYSGSINKRIVEEMRSRGINALGLTGLDGGLLKGRRKTAIRSVENGRVKIIRDDNSGKVEEVNTKLLRFLIDSGYIPVITIPISSEEGRALNADADRVAAAVASAMGAEELILLTNQPGLLRDLNDPGSLVKRIGLDSIEEGMDIARGRMKKKVLAAKEALEGGVKKVVISSALVEAPVVTASSGKGTVIS